jgi:hypothetical protein
MVKRMVLRLGTVFLLAGFLIGVGGSANAGQFCARVNMIDPFSDVRVCVPVL